MLCKPTSAKSAFVNAFVDSFDTPMPDCVKELFAAVYVLRTLLYEWSKYTVTGDGSVNERHAVHRVVRRLGSNKTAPYVHEFLETSGWFDVLKREDAFEPLCHTLSLFIDERVKPNVRGAFDASVLENFIGMAGSVYATQMLEERDEGILECYSKKLDEYSPKSFLKYNVGTAVEQMQAQLVQRNYLIHLLRKKIRMESLFLDEEKPCDAIVEDEKSHYEQKLNAHKEKLRQELELRQELLDELEDWGNELMSHDYACRT